MTKPANIDKARRKKRAKQGKKPETLPEVTMAERFMVDWRTAIDRSTQEPMLWQDRERVWSRGQVKLVAAINEYANTQGERDGNHYNAAFSRSVGDHVFWRAQRNCVATGGAGFNTWPDVLGLPDGKVANLRTGEIRNAQVGDRVTMKTAVMPAEGETTQFDEFLWMMTCEREDLYEYIWRLMGYSIVGTGEQEIAILLRGEGGDGKGTLIGVMQDVLGDYTALLQPDFFKATAERRHQTELAELDRKRLWANPESADGKWVVQRFKTLTGERHLTANRMRQDPVRIDLDGVLWVGVNKIPMLDGGRAMQRRLRVIPCDLRLRDSQINPALKNALLPAEYPQILWKIIRQAAAYHDGGLLPTPPCVAAESDEFLAYSAKPLDSWMEENVEVDEAYSEDYGVLYKDATQWHENAGHRQPTKTAVGRFLKESGYTRHRTNGRTTWNGLRLIT